MTSDDGEGFREALKEASDLVATNSGGAVREIVALRSTVARLTAELAEAREEVTRLKSGLLFFIVDECIETIAGVNVVDACGADAGDPALVTDEQVVAKALARIDAARGEP